MHPRRLRRRRRHRSSGYENGGISHRQHKPQAGMARLGLLARALRPERIQEVVEIEGGKKCKYRTWETMVGHGTMVVNWMMGKKLDEAHKRYADDLKRVVEEKMK